MSTLTAHCQLEDEKVRERTGHPLSYAETKKMKSLTLHAHGCLRASLRESSSSYYKLYSWLFIYPAKAVDYWLDKHQRRALDLGGSLERGWCKRKWKYSYLKWNMPFILRSLSCFHIVEHERSFHDNHKRYGASEAVVIVDPSDPGPRVKAPELILWDFTTESVKGFKELLCGRPSRFYRPQWRQGRLLSRWL